jgi:tetratricopeptide (TPR) repeat protein
MSERLTRREIKEDLRTDEVQSFLVRATQRFEEQPSLILGVVVAAIVVLAGSAALFSWSKDRDAAANTQLGQAQKIWNAPIDAKTPKPDDRIEPSFASEAAREARAKAELEKIKSGVAEEVSSLYLAELGLKSGDKAGARKAWESYLKAHQGDAIAMVVRLNLIELDREEGRGQQVVDALNAELTSPKKSMPDDLLLFELARTYEKLGKRAEARSTYQRIIDEFPASAYTSDAREFTTSES